MHDTIVANIHDMLAHLAYHFSAEQLDQLFSLFQDRCEPASKLCSSVLALPCSSSSFCSPPFLHFSFLPFSLGGSPKNMTRMLQLVRRLAEDDSEGTMALKVLEFLWKLAHEESIPLDIVEIAMESHKMILHVGCFKNVGVIRWL
jgi:hypothetical protein